MKSCYKNDYVYVYFPFPFSVTFPVMPNIDGWRIAGSAY